MSFAFLYNNKPNTHICIYVNILSLYMRMYGKRIILFNYNMRSSSVLDARRLACKEGIKSGDRRAHTHLFVKYNAQSQPPVCGY